MSQRLLVLGWHSIGSTWYYGTSPDSGHRGFERQLGVLRRYANVVPLRPALEMLAERRPLPPRAVALTFDDGYLDNVTVAAPLLRDLGMSATFFLLPGFLSGTSRAWWEELGWAFARATAADFLWEGGRHVLASPEDRFSTMRATSDRLKSLDHASREDAVSEIRRQLAPAGSVPDTGRLFMDWWGARQLVDYGHDIGSHTCSHPILSREKTRTQEYELARSRGDLEARLHRPVDLLAFPNGTASDYSDTTRWLVREAGYAYAFTVRPGWVSSDTPSDVLPRVLVRPQTDMRELLQRCVRGVVRAAHARVRRSVAGRRGAGR